MLWKINAFHHKREKKQNTQDIGHRYWLQRWTELGTDGDRYGRFLFSFMTIFAHRLNGRTSPDHGMDETGHFWWCILGWSLLGDTSIFGITFGNTRLCPRLQNERASECS